MSTKDNEKYNIKYPRRRIPRGILRAVGRVLTPLLCRLDISGQGNFPKSGPLLVVGNHTAVMEAVMLVVFTPWQIEMLGSSDIPHETFTDIITRFFGYIPIHRGRMEKSAMNKALGVLNQRGVLGIFPEGGIWDAGAMKAQSGIAWLSYRSGAPVLPIGFSGTRGALGAAFKLRQPKISMRIGNPIPAAKLPQGKPRKIYFQEYAAKVMEAVRALLPADDVTRQVRILNERFELEVALHGKDGNSIELPPELTIQHASALTKFLHLPAILKIFRKNLRMPIKALQNLDTDHDPREIAVATQHILNYLKNDNPYLLPYRFGPKESEAMQRGLEELLSLAQWATAEGFSLTITPIRRYYRSDQEGEIVQTKQGKFKDWM